MFKFKIHIEQGGQEHRDGDTSWTFKIVRDIYKFVKLTDKELEQYGEAIREDILNNYITGKNINGGSVAPLAASTVARKGHSRVFWDSGQLISSLVNVKEGDSQEIYFLPGRAQIAFWLQTGTGRMPAREAFGVTERKADELLAQILFKSSRRRSAA